MMTIVFFFIRIHQFTLFSRRHPFIQDTTKKTNSVCCVQFKNNNECTYHVWRLLVSHHCLPSNNVPSSFVLCDENTIWWTFFTNVWIWGHTGKVLELKRLDRVILEDAFLGQRFNSEKSAYRWLVAFRYCDWLMMFLEGPWLTVGTFWSPWC